MNNDAHRLPDFIIIGAMKAGTTSLYEYLVSHPQIDKCKRKEPSFFADTAWHKGIGWYKRLFRDNALLKCEASTSYTKYPAYGEVPQRMHETIPDVKLIYIVRNPVERIHSQLHHMAIMYGKVPAVITAENIAERPHFIRLSQYHYQLSQFLKYFDLDKIRIVRFEDLLAQPVQVLRELSEFLGIAGDFYNGDYNFTRHNEVSTSARVKYQRLHYYLYKAHVQLHFPPIHKLFETPVPRPQLTLEAKHFIWDAVQEDLRQFEKLIGRSLHYAKPV